MDLTGLSKEDLDALQAQVNSEVAQRIQRDRLRRRLSDAIIEAEHCGIPHEEVEQEIVKAKGRAVTRLANPKMARLDDPDFIGLEPPAEQPEFIALPAPGHRRPINRTITIGGDSNAGGPEQSNPSTGTSDSQRSNPGGNAGGGAGGLAGRIGEPSSPFI